MIIIYHSRDLDGYCSGAICKKKYPDATLVGFDYGQGLQKLLDANPTGEETIMVDVSLPMLDMLLLSEHCKRKLTWIDHHASAIFDFENFFIENDMITAVLQDGISACEGAWKYLFPSKPMPRAVELLGQYDTWRNSDKLEWETRILPFQYGMRLQCTGVENFPMYLLNDDVSIDEIVDITRIGAAILKYQSQQNEFSMKGSFPTEFEGLRIIACNGDGFNSQAFDSVWDEEKYDAMMPFKFSGKHWTFSLYTTKDIDLSVLAKKYGGGGHKKACGFQTETLPDFIINNQKK